MTSFFAMGGYAFYVWGAYGVATLLLAALIVATVLRHRRIARTLAQLEALRRPDRDVTVRRARPTERTG